MKNRILYHLSHNDLDGYGCQYMTTSVFKKNYCYNTNYNEVNENLNLIFSELLKNKNKKYLLMITDVNLTIENATKLNNFVRGNKNIDVKIVLLDHHISGKDVAEKYSWYYLDKTRCATRLTYEWLLNNNLLNEKQIKIFNYFSSVVNTQDIWLENDVLFNKGVFLSNVVFNFLKYPEILIDFKRNHIFHMITNVLKLFNKNKTIEFIETKLYSIAKTFLNKKIESLYYDNKDIEFKVKLARHFYLLYLAHINQNVEIIEIEGKKGKFLFSFDSNSFQYVSNYYLHEQNDIDFMCHVSSDLKMSLRSRNDTDVSYIAKKYFLGGGHKNASGAYLMDIDFFKNKKITEQKQFESIFKKYILTIV